MREEVIKIRNLKKSFGDNVILNGVDLTLHRGENMVILGKSGVGKSVLTKCVVGLLEHDSGSIEIFGKDIDQLDQQELDAIRMKIGYLFQGGALYDSMSVSENIAFPLLRSRFFKERFSKYEHLIDEVLESVGLIDTKDKMPAELSGGMQKRIGLARTLILQPEIIFYDEPTTGLDPVTSTDISNLIIKINKQYNTSSLIITHDLKCARITGNHLKLLKNGLFYAEGTYDELKDSTDEEVKTYFE